MPRKTKVTEKLSEAQKSFKDSRFEELSLSYKSQSILLDLVTSPEPQFSNIQTQL